MLLAMLKVAIDARTVNERKSGIGNYVEALVRAMLPIADDFRFVLLRKNDAKNRLVDDARVEELRLPGESKSPHNLWIGRIHRFADCDLFHAAADVVPPGIRCPWVVTLHDLMWIEAPRLASAFFPVRAANGWFYRFAFGHAVRGAKRVIAISRATADAVQRVYPEHAHKLSVIHHGIDLERYAPEQAGPRSHLARIVPKDARFSLAVGQGSPYKNHDGLVRAFVEATSDQPDHKLVLVRRFARFDLGMHRLLARPEVREKVISVSFVSDEELLALYRYSEALLFASHYEGFGMPALEAMAMGLPVLISTHPALQEVAGNAALSAISTDHTDLVRKIRMLSHDARLRAGLSAAGKRRAADFSWEKAAKATLEVYRQAVKA